MKAILEFNLPEDNVDYYMAFNGADYHVALTDIEEVLRQNVKYNSMKFNENQIVAIEHIRNAFYDIINNRNINLEL